MWFFKPVCMPEAVAVPSFVANPFTSSLFMWFIFDESFLFKDLMDSVVANVNVLFCKDLLQGDCCERMLFSYFEDDLFLCVCDWFCFSACFLGVRVLVEGVEVVVKLSSPSWCDILGLCDSVGGLFSFVYLFDDPSYFLLIQFPNGFLNIIVFL
jgi:hypothetical protein